MLDTCFSKASSHEAFRFQCVDALWRCYTEMEQWDPDYSPSRLSQAARQHLLLYCELNKETGDQNLWRLYPKHHLFVDLAEESTCNPRMEWNYSDESAIGLAVKQAASCNANYICTHLMQRYQCSFQVADCWQ